MASEDHFDLIKQILKAKITAKMSQKLKSQDVRGLF